jgi:uncharacterized membrane protein
VAEHVAVNAEMTFTDPTFVSGTLAGLLFFRFFRIHQSLADSAVIAVALSIFFFLVLPVVCGRFRKRCLTA